MPKFAFVPQARPFPLQRRRGDSRAGISLLEIMISIGIIGIGLLGVIAMIPLAHFKAAQGIEEDRKAQFGKRAFREFAVREFDRPGALYPDAPNPYFVWPTPGANPYSIYSPVNHQLIRQSYCLDPLGVSGSGSFRFPDNGPLALPRITLLAERPETMRRWRRKTAAQVAQTLFNRVPLLPREAADEVFTLHDDLVYDEPSNKTFAPRPIYLENRKRYANGSYSWMATLVPEPVPTSDQYTLSIVVFHRRALTLEPRQELVVSLPDPALYTLAGGVKEVLLQQPPITNELEKANAGLRHIRHGEWIALMQPTGSGGYVDLRWYEVIRADAVEGDLDTTRELTLAGPDWNPRPGPMYAVYVRNVVAVYEKSIKLHAVSAYPG